MDNNLKQQQKQSELDWIGLDWKSPERQWDRTRTEVDKLKRNYYHPGNKTKQEKSWSKLWNKQIYTLRLFINGFVVVVVVVVVVPNINKNMQQHTTHYLHSIDSLFDSNKQKKFNAMLMKTNSRKRKFGFKKNGYKHFHHSIISITI